jgi:predicted  nucleic acid-binding Zn-ribbon protein
MKLDELKKALAKAQEGLRVAEHDLADLQRKAKAAKAKSEHARLEHKRARKSAKQAKKLVLEAEDRAGQQCRVLAKAQKRLVKALKKAEKAKAVKMKKQPLSERRRRQNHLRKSSRPG